MDREVHEIKEYSADVESFCKQTAREVRGTLDVVVSKSPTKYLKKLAAVGRCKQVACIDNDMSTRYGTKSTPTTRRTSYDNERRKYY